MVKIKAYETKIIKYQEQVSLFVVVLDKKKLLSSLVEDSKSKWSFPKIIF